MSEPRNTIRTWALIAVAVSSVFTIGIAIWLIIILSVQDWCGQALGAAKDAAARPESAIQACFSLMDKQVTTLGRALLIVIGVQALSLLVLIVIVLAGGKLSFRASKDGVEGAIGKEEAKLAGARRVERAAVEEREQIQHEAVTPPDMSDTAEG